ELETQMPAVGPEAGCLGPVLALDVVHDGRLAPCQQCWNDEADTFTGARGCKRQNVFRPVVTEVMNAGAVVRRPAADVNALRRTQKAGTPDVIFAGPPRRSMQVLRVFGELARSPI